MSSARHYKMDEEDRIRLRDLKSKQEALELFIGGGSGNVHSEDVRRYERILNQSNELKREILGKADELDEDLFDYTYFFDSVAGYVWIEDAE